MSAYFTIYRHSHFILLNFSDKAVVNLNLLTLRPVLIIGCAFVYHDLLNQCIQNLCGELGGIRAVFDTLNPLSGIDRCLLFCSQFGFQLADLCKQIFLLRLILL